MCHQKPCFTSLCGLPLTSLVPAIGLLELGMTVVATTLNVIKYTQHLELVGEECLTRDVCIGPLIKVSQKLLKSNYFRLLFQYTVFDGLFGLVCSVLLIVGSLQSSLCLLVTWCVLTVFITVKHVWVLLTHDWTAVEDWISVTFILFISLVFTIVWCRIQEVREEQSTPPAGGCRDCGEKQKSLSLSLRENPVEKCSVKTPDGYPRGTKDCGGGVKLVRSAKMIHCITENGVTKCFTRSTRYNNHRYLETSSLHFRETKLLRQGTEEI